MAAKSIKQVLKAWEKSPPDKKMDSKPGAPKEGSKADMKTDMAGAKRMAAKMKK